MRKATILISHPFYGSSYELPNGELTKDREKAVILDYDNARAKEKEYSKKYACDCYAVLITNQYPNK